MAAKRSRTFIENRKGFAKIRTSPAALAELERIARNMAAAALSATSEDLSHKGKSGIEVDSQVTENNSRASVRTTTRAAIEAEATGRILSKTWQAAGRQ